MPPLLYIVVRRTTNWDDEAVVRAQLPEGFARLVDLWNATFDMAYHRFRVELKRIAEASFARVAGAVVANLGEVPAGSLIAPTDDDDWFAPNLATELAVHAAAGIGGYRWRSRFLEVPPDLDQWLGVWRRRIFGTPPRWSCTTNNHAVLNRGVAAALVGSHLRATEWFDAHPAEVTVLDASLSVQNRNLASQTSMLFRSGAEMTSARLRRRHRRYRALYARPPAAGLEWSRPYIERMADLMNDLRVRR